MEIKELVTKAHDNAVNKGFWDLEKTILTKINESNLFTVEEATAIENAFLSQKLMLVVSELGEAQEAMRKSDWENFDEEIADVVIRVGDLCGGEDIELQHEVQKKMEKNLLRPRLHGKQF